MSSEGLMFVVWTINLKSFEIRLLKVLKEFLEKWTINLKSFEIIDPVKEVNASIYEL